MFQEMLAMTSKDDGVNISSTSVVYEAALSANTSVSISITAKPKYILVVDGSNSAHPNYQGIFYNVEQGKGYQLVRSTSAYANGEVTIGSGGVISQVTQSSITLNNTYTSAKSYSVAVWY